MAQVVQLQSEITIDDNVDQRRMQPILVQKRTIKGETKREKYYLKKIKVARLKNVEYVNSRGNLMEPVKQGYDCGCRRKCLKEVLSESIKTEIYHKFLSFGTKNEQDAYLQSLIVIEPIRYRRRNTSTEPVKKRPKSNSYTYWITSSAGRFQVCRIGFLSVHGINTKRLTRIVRLLREGKAPQDLRGQKIPGNTKPLCYRESIVDHIKIYPIHRVEKKFQFLSREYSVKSIWKNYNRSNPQKTVGYTYFLKIFNNEFNLKFCRERCCDKYRRTFGAIPISLAKTSVTITNKELVHEDEEEEEEEDDDDDENSKKSRRKQQIKYRHN